MVVAADPQSQEDRRDTAQHPNSLREDAEPALGGSYPAMLVGALPVVPILAAIVTIVAYVNGQEPSSWQHGLRDHALLVGSLSALTVWLLGPLFLQRCADARLANARVWAELRGRWCQLDTQLNNLLQAHPQWQSSPDATCEAQRVAYGEADACRHWIHKELYTAGLRWVLGTGYINLRSTIHRAEEALIQIQPEEAVVNGAMYDLARVRGSSIASQEILAGRLIDALSLFCPSDHAYQLLTASAQLHPSHARLQQLRGIHNESEPTQQAPEKEKSLARAVLREIRFDINTFREERWDGLVRARNRLMRTVLAFGIAMVLLIDLAIVVGLQPPTLGTIALFYGIGAIAGLFNRLYLDARTSLAVEDYGLTSARLIHTPLISGLASVGGLVVTAAATNAVLSQAFDLTVHNLIVAALFGLTPGLLISRLQQQVEQNKRDLVTSEPTQGTS